MFIFRFENWGSRIFFKARFLPTWQGSSFAIDTLKMLINDRHRLILWSVREGVLLEEAVEYCRKRGVEFYAVNKDYPEEKTTDRNFSRKLKVDMFIDDRNLGGIPDWGTIYRMIKEKKSYADIVKEEMAEQSEDYYKPKSKWWQLG